MEDKVIDIEELAQDAHNFNKGNEQGQQLMERSFKELGAGRSILLDRNGNIIAGNKSQQAAIAASIYEQHPSDGKYIIQGVESLGWWMFDVTICQSHLSREQEPELREHLENAYGIHLPVINPLGEWTGGPNTDSGATNRKLGSDMGDGVTGGGLHGKDLSKGDVSINIVCFLKAVQSGQTVTACCSIGDEHVTFTYASGKTETETFADVVEMARLYILTDCGGSFERFSEWGLIRPKDLTD